MAENQIVVYRGDGGFHLEVKTDGETVWLTQAQMCQLLGRERSVITKHIRNIFNEGELEEKVVCAKFAHTTSHGAMVGRSQTQEITLYNLDVVISVGYRVKSVQGTRFRQWATRVLREMLLNRLEELKRIGRLEQRMEKVETNVERLCDGMDYLARQLETDAETPHPRIGFGAKEGEVVTKPYGRAR